MTTTFSRVRPGDLITTEEWNRVLDTIESFEDRIIALESSLIVGGDVIITQIVPAGTESDPIRPNKSLRIHGYNFRFSLGAQRVFINDVRVDVYNVLESGDELLVITAPNFTGLPAAGQEMELRVENGTSTARRVVLVQPPEELLIGDVDVLWRDDVTPNPNPNPIPANQMAATFRFIYWIRSRASSTANFTVNPTVSIADWQSNVQILDQAGMVIADRRIQLEPLEERTFSVRIGAVATGPVGTPFDLIVVATADGVSGSDPRRDFQVGVPVEPSDPHITLVHSDVSVYDVGSGEEEEPDGSGFDPFTNTINVQPGKKLFMRYDVTFTDPEVGSYLVMVEPTLGTTGWDLNATPPNYPAVTMGAHETPQFSVQPQAGATETGGVVFRIRREGVVASQIRAYTLRLSS
jgi:hypothetical protein